MANKPVSPNLDVSNILYDHYFAACLNAILSNPNMGHLSRYEIIHMSHEMTLLAIEKRNEK